MDKETVREALRSGGDEFHYRDSNCDIGGHLISETSLEIKHFVVKRSERQQGIASTLLDCLFDVMREEGLSYVEIEMGATESSDLEELDEYRDEHGEEDPTYLFLQKRGFRNLSYEENWQWGLVVQAAKMV